MSKLVKLCLSFVIVFSALSQGMIVSQVSAISKYQELFLNLRQAPSFSEFVITSGTGGLIDPHPTADFIDPIDGATVNATLFDQYINVHANGNTNIVGRNDLVFTLVVSPTENPVDINANYYIIGGTGSLTFDNPNDIEYIKITNSGVDFFDADNYFYCILEYDNANWGNFCGGIADPTHIKLTHSSTYTSLYRFWSAGYNGHFFTNSLSERTEVANDNPNWMFEGLAYDVVALTNNICNDLQAQMVHRFWSDVYNRHFYTKDVNELADLITNDPNWSYEGPVFCAYSGQIPGSTPVYRFYSPVYSGHFYTHDLSEKNGLESNNPNWNYEGVAYYAMP